MGQLYVPNSVAPVNFESIFKNNTFDFRDGRAEVAFHPTYVAMHPIGLAFYAALSDYFHQNGIQIEGSINTRISSIPYLQRMGLFRAFGFLDPRTITEHEESGRFIPLMKIKDNADLDRFLKQIDPVLHTTQENSRIIKHVFSELLRNVLEHSRAPNGGNVCATYNRKRKKISIGISDAGQGLFNSLRGNHHVTCHREAVELALRPGISGTTSRIGGTPENAGAGLFFTKCIAQSTRNYFLLYSGDAYYKLWLTPRKDKVHYEADPLKDRHMMRDGLPSFNGTLVGIDINIEDTEAFNNLMSSIGVAFATALKKTRKDYRKRIQFV